MNTIFAVFIFQYALDHKADGCLIIKTADNIGSGFVFQRQLSLFLLINVSGIAIKKKIPVILPHCMEIHSGPPDPPSPVLFSEFKGRNCPF